MPPTSTEGRWKRLAWFFAIAIASSAATAAVAYGLRALLR
jgi:hypothetical protein